MCTAERVWGTLKPGQTGLADHTARIPLLRLTLTKCTRNRLAIATTIPDHGPDAAGFCLVWGCEIMSGWVQTRLRTAATGRSLFSDTFRLGVISARGSTRWTNIKLLDNILLVINISVDKSPLRIIQNLKCAILCEQELVNHILDHACECNEVLVVQCMKLTR